MSKTCFEYVSKETIEHNQDSTSFNFSDEEKLSFDFRENIDTVEGFNDALKVIFAERKQLILEKQKIGQRDESKFFIEILKDIKEMEGSYEHLMPQFSFYKRNLFIPLFPPTKSEIIEEERKINLDFYNKHENEINEKYEGKYVVIAEGEIKSIGNSLKDVENVSLDSNHRFIFEVKPKKEVRGTLIWPMERV